MEDEDLLNTREYEDEQEDEVISTSEELNMITTDETRSVKECHARVNYIVCCFIFQFGGRK